MNILVTGTAGFIGSATTELLLGQGHRVWGIDNLNNYYDVRLKMYRLRILNASRKFRFTKLDLENLSGLKSLFRRHRFDAVINLAARAGVPYSIKDPFVYVRTNTMGTLNLLECCRHSRIKKFVLASTSSLYSNADMPFIEAFPANRPISPYAASKKGAEAMCYSYFNLFGISTTVLRYFTVYGPAGRPDMSLFRFIQWTMSGKPLLINGDGMQTRDFTYVEDIARGTVNSLGLGGYEIINLGGDQPHSLLKVIGLIEKGVGCKAKINHGPPLKIDIRDTRANISKARKLLGWRPEVSIDAGIRKTVEWHKENSRWLRSVKMT